MQRRDSNSSQSSSTSTLNANHVDALAVAHTPSIIAPMLPGDVDPASSSDEAAALETPVDPASQSDPGVWALIPPSLAAQLATPPPPKSEPRKGPRPPKGKNWKPNVRSRVPVYEVLEDYGSEDELPGSVLERLCVMGTKRSKAK